MPKNFQVVANILGVLPRVILAETRSHRARWGERVMIGFGAIVKMIARTVASAASSVDAGLGHAVSALTGKPRKPALVPIPVRRAGRSR